MTKVAAQVEMRSALKDKIRRATAFHQQARTFPNTRKNLHFNILHYYMPPIQHIVFKKSDNGPHTAIRRREKLRLCSLFYQKIRKCKKTNDESN